SISFPHPFSLLNVSSYTTSCFFFFTATATSDIYTLSLHDALPISSCARFAGAASPRRRNPRAPRACRDARRRRVAPLQWAARSSDRKSTRLNSSHVEISYAVFCLKKKKKKKKKKK